MDLLLKVTILNGNKCYYHTVYITSNKYILNMFETATQNKVWWSESVYVRFTLSGLRAATKTK